MLLTKMFKGYLYDSIGNECSEAKPIELLDCLEASIVEVMLTFGYRPIVVSLGNGWALFEISPKQRLMVTEVES
ncbi:hypothetical protein AZ468_25045 (plasmid) [Vibrio europaeus]|uniref:Uncharacterized protein n=1 Tax=Vibrio europaeus TaxID=300876 RepID=A0A178J3X9_9VIBR|nr:hypothetical protein AZ468_25045 [Vibrio europaeus]